MPAQGSTPGRTSISAPSTRHGGSSGSSTSDDAEVLQVKRRIFSNRIISVNFLVNDLGFYLEMEK